MTDHGQSAARSSHISHRSLTVRYVGLIVAIVVASGLLIGTAVTLASARNAAQERLASIEYASRVAAGALMPVVADQDTTRIQAQLRSIMSVSEGLSIQCIEIIDSSGAVIAESEKGCTCDLVEPSRGLFDVFTKPQVTTVPVQVGGLEVARVRIQFKPVGLETALVEPGITTGLVLVFAMIIAGLWGGWLIVRTVVEPIGTLRDAAENIAAGERDVSLDHGRGDEIGELARSLETMTEQLQQQEKQLLESYSSLESAYNDQADLARRLERMIALKSDFVAVASHELRSPLSVISLYAEMLEDNEFGEIDQRLASAVEAIISAAGRLSAIVSSLMDVALLERGLMSLEYDDVDLGALLEQAVEDASVVGATAGVEIRGAGEFPETVVRGDAVRLRQAIDNLLSNAIKYSGPRSSVDVGLTIEAVEAVISVTDRGRGVPPDRADILFELFVRGDASDNADVAGLGLGLPIAARITRAHGGTITFEPNPEGAGSIFRIHLPLGGEDGPGTISFVE